MQAAISQNGLQSLWPAYGRLHTIDTAVPGTDLAGCSDCSFVHQNFFSGDVKIKYRGLEVPEKGGGSIP